ncbi:MAG: hypothetical protein WCR39_06165 [Bacteroidales bacterium]
MKRKIIFVLNISVIIVMSLFLCCVFTSCGKDNADSLQSAEHYSIQQGQHLKGKWGFKKITHKDFKDAQEIAFRKMAKKIKEKAKLEKRRINASNNLPESAIDALDVPINSNYFVPAPPPIDSLPTAEEIELYMDEEIAQEYFEAVKPSIINFTYNFLNLDLTSAECFGTDTDPRIMMSGVMVDGCQTLESLGYCLDSVAMGLTGGIPLKAITITEAVDCMVDALGLSVGVTLAGTGAYAMWIGRAAFKAWIKTGAGLPVLSTIAAAVMLAKYASCCWRASET